MFKYLLAIALVLGGCKPTTPTESPKPMKSAVQPAPSWTAGMEPGCWVVGEPVAPECLEGGAPQCKDTLIGPCWIIDSNTGEVWYRP